MEVMVEHFWGEDLCDAREVADTLLWVDPVCDNAGYDDRDADPRTHGQSGQPSNVDVADVDDPVVLGRSHWAEQGTNLLVNSRSKEAVDSDRGPPETIAATSR